MKIRVQHHIPKLLFITGRSIGLQSSWRCVSRLWAFPDAGSTVNSTLVAGLTHKIWKQKVASVLAILLVAWPLIVLTLWNNQRSIIHHLYCRWRVKTSLHIMTSSLFTYQHQQCDLKKKIKKKLYILTLVLVVFTTFGFICSETKICLCCWVRDTSDCNRTGFIYTDWGQT